jgi:phospholipid transport system substrate-binding protein
MTTISNRSAISRRGFLAGASAVALLGMAMLQPARAQSAPADAFVKSFADKLIAVVNGPGSATSKQQALAPLIDDSVDVAAIAKFCLGRFWASASPSQQQAYTQLFHQVLLNNISGHLGEYQGVSYSMTGTHAQGADSLVGTVINRPSAPAANVQWVVRTEGGSPKILDVVAEGTSLRLTQRQDYASYLSRHGSDIDALIAALKRQLNG